MIVHHPSGLEEMMEAAGLPALWFGLFGNFFATGSLAQRHGQCLVSPHPQLCNILQHVYSYCVTKWSRDAVQGKIGRKSGVYTE